MTQRCWKTLAAALLLAAGIARAEPPSPSPGPAQPIPIHPGADCSIRFVQFLDGGTCCPCEQAGCCGTTGTTAKAASCRSGCAPCTNSQGGVSGGIVVNERNFSTEAKGSCCCGKGAAKTSCCADCGKGCACCSKGGTTAAGCACAEGGCCAKGSCSCGKAEKTCSCTDAKGCACCAKRVAAAAGCPCCGKCCACGTGDGKTAPTKAKKARKGTKPVTVFVLPMLPPPGMGPYPFPAPPVGFEPPPPEWRGEPLPPPAIATAPVPTYACPQPMPPAGYTAGGPYPEPVQPAVRMVPPPPVVSCGMTQACRTEAHGCSLRVVTEDGADCLEVHGGAATRLTCDHLSLKVAGQKSVKAVVAGKQVAISSPVLKARADRISLTEGEGRLVLDGHVRLEYRPGQEESSVVVANRVVLNLAEGAFEFKVESAGSLETHTQAPTPPAIEAVFNSWIGMLH